MPYLNTDEWEKSRQRFEAWWHGDVVDRVLLQVSAPKANPEPVDPPPPYRDMNEKWLSVDWRLAAFEHNFAKQYYGGDYFPYIDTHIGPGTMSLYLGAKPVMDDRTVWYHKCIDDITTAEVPEFDEDNPYWKFSVELARQAVQQLRGRALVSFPDLIEGLDTISSLVGNDELLYYLIDQPAHVHRFQGVLTDVYFDFHDRLYNIIADEHGGSCFSAFSTYAPGPMAKVECDFSAMISPEMFAEFVAPYLAEQCARLEYSVFHLDGPNCTQHLDILLDIPDLNAIQWTPGAGQPGVDWEGYYPMYAHILAGGKSVMIRGASPEGAKRLVETFGPAGLDIMTWTDTQQEADELVKDSFKWKKQR